MKSGFHAGFVVLMARHSPQSVCNPIAHERASIPVDGGQFAAASFWRSYDADSRQPTALARSVRPAAWVAWTRRRATKLPTCRSCLYGLAAILPRPGDLPTDGCVKRGRSKRTPRGTVGHAACVRRGWACAPRSCDRQIWDMGAAIALLQASCAETSCPDQTSA